VFAELAGSIPQPADGGSTQKAGHGIASVGEKDIYYPGNMWIRVIQYRLPKSKPERASRWLSGFAAFRRPKGGHRRNLKFISTSIPQAPEAFLTLSFRLDLTIYRRYNPRT